MTRLNYPSMQGQKKSKGPRTESETQDLLNDIWDEEVDDRLELVQDLIQQFGTDEFVEYLNHSGLGNYAGLIQRFYEVAENREKALKGLGDNPLQYDSMTNATVKSLNLQTRDDLNRAFSDARDSYVAEYGNDINTALPQNDLFIVP